MVSACQVGKSRVATGPPLVECNRRWTARDSSHASRSPRKGSTPSSLVLDEIRLGRSRLPLGADARTGLGRAIVAQRVGELIERGLVRRGRARAAAPAAGRRASSTFRADAGHVLVADLGATSIDVAMTDLDGPDPRPPRRARRHRRRAGGAAWSGSRSCSSELRADDPRPARPAVGRRHRHPRPVEFRTGRPISPPIMPGWDGYPVRERFAARYGAPVWVDNDVNVLAIGEWRIGHRRGPRQRGRRQDRHGHRRRHHLRRPPPPRRPGQRRDVGHIQVIDDASVVCRCGNVGCLEALAGGAALGRDGEAAARDGSQRAAAGRARPATAR